MTKTPKALGEEPLLSNYQLIHLGLNMLRDNYLQRGEEKKKKPHLILENQKDN